MTTEPIIIVHGADSDGLASAALLRDRLGCGEVRFADYDTLPTVFQEAAGAEAGRPIHYADLALRAPAIPDDLLLELTSGREVHGYDHHEIGEPERRALLVRRLTTFVHAVGGSCAARLIVDHFSIDGEQHRLLADAAQGSDYWGSVPAGVEALGRALDRLIWEIDRAEIVEALVRGLHDPAHAPWQRGLELAGPLGEAHIRAMARVQRQLEQLWERVTHHDVAGVEVACTLAADQLYPKEGLHALGTRCPDADLLVVLYEGTTALIAALSRRGIERGLPLVEFLTAQGGGGRNDKGGLRYSDNTTEANYPARRDALLEALERFVSEP